MLYVKVKTFRLHQSSPLLRERKLQTGIAPLTQTSRCLQNQRDAE